MDIADVAVVTLANTEKLTRWRGSVGSGRARGTLGGPRDRDINCVVVAAVLTNGEKSAPQMGRGDRNKGLIVVEIVHSGRKRAQVSGRVGRINFGVRRDGQNASSGGGREGVGEGRMTHREGFSHCLPQGREVVKGDQGGGRGWTRGSGPPRGL